MDIHIQLIEVWAVQFIFRLYWSKNRINPDLLRDSRCRWSRNKLRRSPSKSPYIYVASASSKLYSYSILLQKRPYKYQSQIRLVHVQYLQTWLRIGKGRWYKWRRKDWPIDNWQLHKSTQFTGQTVYSHWLWRRWDIFKLGRVLIVLRANWVSFIVIGVYPAEQWSPFLIHRYRPVKSYWRTPSS